MAKYLEINERDRIAQLILQKIAHSVKLIEVKDFDDKTDRGASGFSSTNNKTCQLKDL